MSDRSALVCIVTHSKTMDFQHDQKNAKSGRTKDTAKADVRVRIRRIIVQIRSEHTGIRAVVPVGPAKERAGSSSIDQTPKTHPGSQRAFNTNAPKLQKMFPSSPQDSHELPCEDNALSDAYGVFCCG